MNPSIGLTNLNIASDDINCDMCYVVICKSNMYHVYPILYKIFKNSPSYDVNDNVQGSWIILILLYTVEVEIVSHAANDEIYHKEACISDMDQLQPSTHLWN